MDRVVAFYSFKGGAGRTTGLANVAVGLASAGKNVLCVDLDVEGAGLQYVLAGKEGCNTERDVRDLLRRGAADFSLDKYTVDITMQQKDKLQTEGKVLLMPAGTAWKEVELHADTIDVVLKPLFRGILAGDFGIRIDCILLDGASGFRKAAYICWYLANLILIFYRFSLQHLMGAREAHFMFNWLTAEGKRPLRSSHFEFIGSCVPSNMDEKTRKVKVDLIKSILQEKYHEELEIPENDILKFDDRVLVAVPHFKTSKKHHDVISAYETVSRLILDRIGTQGVD